MYQPSRVYEVVSRALLGVALLGGRVEARTLERIAAVVNEDIVLDGEVNDAALPQFRGDRESGEGRKRWDELRRKALEQLIDSKLVGQQALELKLSVTVEEVDRASEEVRRQNKLDESTFAEALKQQGLTPETYRKSLKKQILELKVFNTAVRSRISVGDEEVRAYYQQNARQMGEDARPFDEIKEQLRRTLYDQQVEKATQSWLRELRRKAHIDIR